VRDQIICFPRLAREGEDPVLFRRVEIWDAEKQEAIVFLSNGCSPLRRSSFFPVTCCFLTGLSAFG
jgi:hypothetical protein